MFLFSYRRLYLHRRCHLLGTLSFALSLTSASSLSPLSSSASSSSVLSRFRFFVRGSGCCGYGGCGEIDPKLAPGEAPGHPKLSQNRSRMSHGARERSEGVSGAPRERLGTSPACPGIVRRVPKGTPGRQKERPGASGSAPGRPKATPSGIRERKNRIVFARLVCKASSEQFFVDFGRFLLRLQSLRTLESAAPASENEGSPLRAESRVARSTHPRKTMKNDARFGRFGCVRRQIGSGFCRFGHFWRQGGAGFDRFGRTGRLEAPPSSLGRRSLGDFLRF